MHCLLRKTKDKQKEAKNGTFLAINGGNLIA